MVCKITAHIFCASFNSLIVQLNVCLQRYLCSKTICFASQPIAYIGSTLSVMEPHNRLIWITLHMQ